MSEAKSVAARSSKKRKPKLPMVPPVDGRQFLSRLRKELRAVCRRREKITALTSRLADVRLRRGVVERVGFRQDRRSPVDPEVKALVNDIRRLLDEVSLAANRIVSSRLTLSLGEEGRIGKVDLATDERASVSVMIRDMEKPTVALLRVLFEIIDGSLYELEQAVREQYLAVSTLRQEAIILH